MLSSEFKFLLRYISRYKVRYILAGILIVLGSVSGMIVPWFFKLVVDNIKSGSIDKTRLLYYCLGIVSLSILSGIFFFLQRTITMNLSRRIESDIRDEIFAHLLTLSQSFYKKNSSGDLISRMNNDLGSIRMFLGFGFSTLLRTIFMVSIGTFFMLRLSTKVFLFLVIPVPLFLLSMKIFMAKVHAMWEKIQELLGTITEFAREQISGIRLTRAYSRGENIKEKYSSLQWDYLKKSMTALKIFGLFEGFAMSIVGITELIIIFVGGREVILNRMTLGSLIAYHGYLMLLLWPLFGLGWLLAQYERARASLERINEILRIEPDIRDSGEIELKSIEKGITFDNVYFAYDGKKTAIDGVSFHIRPNEFVGIVGKIGAGKTALVELLPRLWDPQKGKILIDNLPIDKYSLRSLREKIGFVPQDSFIFSRSIKENIELGQNSITEDEIVNILKEVDFEKDLRNFTDGINTVVGERGVTLSGGQKQRLAIARAISKKPLIMVLDDSFSSIDTDTEKNIIENLRKYKGKATIIFITHRFSSLVDADRIMVIENGRIVEQGSHKELIEKNGYYKRLIDEQTLTEEL